MSDEVQTKIKHLMEQRDQLEALAVQHERKAREARSQRDKVKQDLQDLVKAQHELATSSAAANALKLAEAARSAAEKSASDAKTSNDVLVKLISETEKLKGDLEAKLKELGKSK